MKRIHWYLFAITLSIFPARAGVVFTLDPSNGFLQGAAGTSVGWGYSITTDFAHVSIESFTFNESGTPIGTFESAGGVPSADITPVSPLTPSWIQDTSGLQYDIAAGTPVGFATQGTITLTYDAFDDSFNQIVFGDTVNAQFNSVDTQAEVFVNGAGTTVPEPAAWTLFAAAAAALQVRRRPRR